MWSDAGRTYPGNSVSVCETGLEDRSSEHKTLASYSVEASTPSQPSDCSQRELSGLPWQCGWRWPALSWQLSWRFSFSPGPVSPFQGVGRWCSETVDAWFMVKECEERCTKDLDVPTSLGLLDDLFRAGFVCAFPIGSRLQKLWVPSVFKYDYGNYTPVTVWYHRPAAQPPSSEPSVRVCFSSPIQEDRNKDLRASHLFGR